MAPRLAGGNVQAMQQFISTAPWEDEPILARHQELVAQTLGDPETGVLIVDGCDFPKQGQHSVGVARQYCGALGKIANCQASVVACYASARDYTLVDRRLYLPASWFGDDAGERRAACGVPEGLRFQTRPELAQQMIATLHRRGVLPFRWVLCDEGFGDHPAFLDGLAAAGLWSFAEVAHDTRVWLTRPPTVVPPRQGRRGRVPTRPRLAPTAPAAQTVVQVAAALPPEQWQQTVLQEGSKGSLVVDLAWRRVVAVRDGLPRPEVWLVLRRSEDSACVGRTAQYEPSSRGEHPPASSAGCPPERRTPCRGRSRVAGQRYSSDRPTAPTVARRGRTTAARRTPVAAPPAKGR